MFTGKLESGPRKKAQATVVSLGGSCHDKVRVDSDFLVIGALGTDHWKTSRYGTKIEEVMHHRSASGRRGSEASWCHLRYPPQEAPQAWQTCWWSRARRRTR